MKKLILGLGLVAVIAVAAFQLLGLRISLDGSGRMPRFISRRPDYDALEASRRAQPQTPAREPQRAPVTTQDPAPAASTEAQPAAAPSPAAASANTTTPTTLPPGPAESVAPSLPSISAEDRPVSALPRESWTDFRGPARDGRYEGAIRTDWPASGLRQLWKQPVGEGYASFVVASGRAFTIEQRREQEVVAAYDVETGHEIWTDRWDAAFRESLGGDGPRATPTYHEGRIYALGAEGELRCLDAQTGAVVWRRNILTETGAANLPWGMSASPLIVDDKVIVLPGAGGDKSVVAYNKTTGAVVWGSLNDPQAYTSPMLVTLNGIRQILVVSAERAMGLTVDEGRVLWEYPWVTEVGINVAQPLVVGGNRVFLSAAYGHGAALIEISDADGRFTTRTVWENNRMKNKFASSVLRDGFIYGLDESILACMDAATGELKWKAGRYGYGQILLAGTHIVVLTEDGEVVLVNAGPDRFEQLARFPAIEGKTWNHPVIVDGRLLVRNSQEMAAFDIGVKRD